MERKMDMSEEDSGHGYLESGWVNSIVTLLDESYERVSSYEYDVPAKLRVQANGEALAFSPMLSLPDDGLELLVFSHCTVVYAQIEHGGLSMRTRLSTGPHWFAEPGVFVLTELN